ncbi:hypothetical protein HZF02_32430 (plasmid) [Pseudomonas yamanorum]|nr:hypothetical protein HZF02_32430 [Pseudomonas yamanorum]
MASMNLRTPFSVLIKDNQLVITQVADGVKRTFCTLYLDDQASFCLRDGKVVYLAKYGQDFTFDSGLTLHWHRGKDPHHINSGAPIRCMDRIERVTSLR